MNRVKQGTSYGLRDKNSKEHQLHHLEQRCAKLKRKLQEKEAIIQAVEEKQPLLIHETKRNLRSLVKTHFNRAAHGMPVSHSALSSMAHERYIVDARIHEYELQIAELYKENKQERLKNEMLNECLCEQKRAKAKLMKACKHAKQGLQAAKDSGLSQMLIDIEVRCDALEKENAQIGDELRAERSVRRDQEFKLKATTKQLEKLMLESTKWAGIVARKGDKLRHARDQICEQQVMIENLNADVKQGKQRFSPSPECCHDEGQEETERLGSIMRSKVRKAEQELLEIKAENEFLRDQLFIQKNKRAFASDKSSWTAQDTSDKLLIQVQLISKKLRSLKKMVQVYEETNTVDITLLDESNLSCKINFKDGSPASDVDVTQLSCSVLEAARYVTELQQTVEDACARLLGSTCAMQ